MKKNVDSLNGFYYVLEDEVIREYMKMSPQVRLQWLEDAYNFFMTVKDSRIKESWQKFRRGEI